METKKCKLCGKKFLRNQKYSKLQWNEARYCSRSCGKRSHKPSRIAVERMRRTLTGRKLSPEHVEKIRLSCIGPNGHHKSWKGGISKLSSGYLVYNHDGKLLHRKVMEDYIGRKLTDNESVHHVDKNVTNNDISNLLLLTKSEHSKLHFPKGSRFGKNKERIFND